MTTTQFIDYKPLHTDADDHTYPGAIRFVPAAVPQTGPERMQQEIDDLRKRVAHLEACVQRLLNQDGEL